MSPTKAAVVPSLFEQLRGSANIATVVAEVIGRVAQRQDGVVGQ